MKIIILGAGQVGGTLAENLVREDNDITLVDKDAERLEELQQSLDIRTIIGHASHPDVLEDAGCDSADLLIAVTNSDETNMVGCQVAYSLFNTPMRIARVRAGSYISQPRLFAKRGFNIDICISPEKMVTTSIERLVQYPGSLQVLDFADGKVQLVAVRPYFGGPLVGKTIRDLHQSFPDVHMRVAAIFRHNQSLPITGSTVLEIGDEVFFIATPQHIRKILKALGRFDNSCKRIMIAGGGHIGFRLAQVLEEKYRVKIIDHNVKRTKILADYLNSTTVLWGDASDRDLLINENIEHIDVFCAVTNDDEANIMSCLQAKRLGARQVMALINRTAYVDLVDGGMIDIAISPQQATISGILRLIRRGDMVNVHSLRRGAAEAIELVAHGDKTTSKVVGRQLKDIALPRGAMIGAIVRDEQVLMARSDLIIESEDHVILFVVNKKSIRDVEHLFQVSVAFIS